MAQGDVHLDGNGKVSLDAAGKVRLHDAGSDCPDCCGPDCVASASPCTHCDDITPSQYTVLTSSILLSCGCQSGSTVTGGDFDLNNATSLATANASRVVTKPGAAGCVWTRDNGAETFKQINYTSVDLTCVGGDTESNPNVYLWLERTATDWVLELFTSAASLRIIFAGTVPATDDGGTQICATAPNISNSLVVGDCGNTYASNGFGNVKVVGYGGSATVTCVE